eukprot:Skav210449  [mRNA]  locus=scaffold1297:187158:188075:+ [translate_table: standard]
MPRHCTVTSDIAAAASARKGPARLEVLILLFAVSHWCACFWHAVGSEEARLAVAVEQKKYTWSLYFTLTTLTTVGYGHGAAKTAQATNVFALRWRQAVVLCSFPITA